MATTLLSTFISRMQRYQPLLSVDTVYLVRDIDEALRTLKRTYNLPFYQKKSSLKVFADVLQYPPATDHDYLLYIDYPQINLQFPEKFRARYTSFRQFFEDPDNRNQISEIWENGSLTLGVRQNSPNSNVGLASSIVSPADSTTGYTASGDASNLVVDYVNYIDLDSSIQFTVTDSSGTATVSDVFTGTTVPDYQQKYYFRWVYLDSVPTSIALRFGVDDSNYLTSTVTTQFAGQPLIADQWNFVAFNLNAATTVGTINTNSVFAYEATILNGAASGTYNLGQSFLKDWMLMDYWYQSKFAVVSSGASAADKQYFLDSSDTYDLQDALIGDEEWADVIMYEAMIYGMSDKESEIGMMSVKDKRDLAWEKLTEKWPDMKPQMTTNRYRFRTEMASPNTWYGGWY